MSITYRTVVMDGTFVNIPGRMYGDVFFPIFEVLMSGGSVISTGHLMGEVKTFSIAAAATGSAVDPVNLGGTYEKVIIRCEDCQYIPAATGLTAQIGMTADDTMCDLYLENDPSTKWSKANLPVTGTLHFVVSLPGGLQRIRLILSSASSGGTTTFKVYGLNKMQDRATWSLIDESWENILENWEDLQE